MTHCSLKKWLQLSLAIIFNTNMKASWISYTLSIEVKDSDFQALHQFLYVPRCSLLLQTRLCMMHGVYGDWSCLCLCDPRPTTTSDVVGFFTTVPRCGRSAMYGYSQHAVQVPSMKVPTYLRPALVREASFVALPKSVSVPATGQLYSQCNAVGRRSSCRRLQHRLPRRRRANL